MKPKEITSAEEHLDAKANKGLARPGPGHHTRESDSPASGQPRRESTARSS